MPGLAYRKRSESSITVRNGLACDFQRGCSLEVSVVIIVFKSKANSPNMLKGPHFVFALDRSRVTIASVGRNLGDKCEDLAHFVVCVFYRPNTDKHSQVTMTI